MPEWAHRASAYWYDHGGRERRDDARLLREAADEIHNLREEAASAMTCIGLLRWALRDAPEGQSDYRPYVEYENLLDVRCPIPPEFRRTPRTT